MEQSFIMIKSNGLGLISLRYFDQCLFFQRRSQVLFLQRAKLL